MECGRRRPKLWAVIRVPEMVVVTCSDLEGSCCTKFDGCKNLETDRSILQQNLMKKFSYPNWSRCADWTRMRCRVLFRKCVRNVQHWLLQCLQCGQPHVRHLFLSSGRQLHQWSGKFAKWEMWSTKYGRNGCAVLFASGEWIVGLCRMRL